LQIGKIVIPVTTEDIEEGKRRTQNQVREEPLPQIYFVSDSSDYPLYILYKLKSWLN